MLATGGSRKARRVVEAVELANGTSSELHVVYVVPMVPELPYPRSSTKERSEALLEPRRLGGLRLLDEQVRRIKSLDKAWRRSITGRTGQRRRASVSAKSSTPA